MLLGTPPPFAPSSCTATIPMPYSPHLFVSSVTPSCVYHAVALSRFVILLSGPLPFPTSSSTRASLFLSSPPLLSREKLYLCLALALVLSLYPSISLSLSLSLLRIPHPHMVIDLPLSRPGSVPHLQISSLRPFTPHLCRTLLLL